MKQALLFLVLFISFVPSLYSQQELKGADLCSEKKIKSAFTYDVEKAPIVHSFDVLDYKLDLDIYRCFISPYPKTFTGEEIITLKADSVISSITLNAVNSSLQINSVGLAAASFTHLNNILTITLDRTYAVGETLKVKILYQHKTPPLQDGWYTSNGVVFTDAEPEGARTWFPCWDKPSDKATTDIRVKVPATVKMGGNGRLADSVKSQDTIWYNWVSRDPVATYLTVLTGKVNYQLEVFYWPKISNPNEFIPIRLYYNAGETALNYKQSILNMTTHFSNIANEHPFEKNGFALVKSSEGFTWGGMENQTLTTLYSWNEGLISHEYFHQWFGDMITCATWGNIGFNEGWATYGEALWLEYKTGYSAYKSDINGNASSYLSSNPGWPIYNPSWDVVTPSSNQLFNTAVTYYKGSCVLHMLRYVMGDNAFFQATKNFANQYKFKSVTIADMQQSFSASYGQDLSTFFNQWYNKPNHPTYANQYAITTIPNNKWEVNFLAKQTQTNTGFFEMPIEIKVVFATGGDTTIKVLNNVNSQIFTFAFSKQPTSVVFDPNNNIVLKTASLVMVPTIPVELTSFTAAANGNIVLINWETATEINNNGFEVQRAPYKDSDKNNELDFRTIGFVKGKGTTTNKKTYSFTDKIDAYGKYVYRLKQVDFNGNFENSTNVIVTAGIVASDYTLFQNYPNPFNPSTTIQFALPKAAKVKLTVYNMLGQVVKVLAEGIYSEGLFEKSFDASGLSSGMYIYELKSDEFQLRKKMILEK